MISRAEPAKTVNTVPTADAPPPAAKEAEPAAVLPAPDLVSGDPVAMIAKLFVKSAQQKRASDDLTAKTEEQAEDAADAKRIEAMKTKADMTFAAGMVGGLSQAASGGCSLAGGIASARALNSPAPASPLTPGAAEPPDLRGATAQSLSTKWEGVGGITGGLGKVGETFLRRSADREDEHIAKAETEGKIAKRAQEALHKEVDAATQHEGKVIQLLQEIKQAQAQCEHAALLRMA